MRLALSLVLMTVLTGCLPNADKSKLIFEPLANTDFEVEAGPEMGPDEVVTFDQLKTQILATKCIACHKGFAEEKKVLKYVEAGDPDNSELFQVVKDGSMPKNGKPLTTKELAVVVGYINGLKTPVLVPAPTEPVPAPTEPVPAPTEPVPAPTEPVPAPTEPVPSPTEPVPAPEPTPTEPEIVSFESFKEKILATKCIACHKGFADEKRVLRYVEVGDVEGSELYQVVKDGSMPKNGSPLTTTELDFVKRYIESIKPTSI